MDYSFVRDLLKCSTGLDLHIIPAKSEELSNLLGEAVRGVLASADANNLINQLFSHMRPGIIYEVKAILGVCYTAIKDYDDNFLLLGPCLEESFSQREVQRLLHNSSYASWAISSFIEYCRYLPIVSHQKRHQIAHLLAKKLLNSPESVPFQRLNFDLSQDEKNKLLLADQYEEISKIRFVEKQHELLSSLAAAVKEGNLSLAYSFLNGVGDSPERKDIGGESVRGIQNNCIVLNARLHKAMEECGIHPYSLSKISSDISSHIEKMKNVRDAQRYPAEIVRLYCTLANENKFQNLPPFSKQVATYIKNHLSDNISVKSTAAALVMNPDYLSWRFHQESGETFINFLNRERIEQAALLLKNTNMLIKEVAASVGFNNTSYFAKQFTTHMNISPSLYRREATL